MVPSAFALLIKTWVAFVEDVVVELVVEEDVVVELVVEEDVVVELVVDLPVNDGAIKITAAAAIRIITITTIAVTVVLMAVR